MSTEIIRENLRSKIPSWSSTIHDSDHKQNMSIVHKTRNTLDCDQSNYSSRIVFSHIPIEFGATRNSAIPSADTENPTLEPNMK